MNVGAEESTNKYFRQYVVGMNWAGRSLSTGVGRGERWERAWWGGERERGRTLRDERENTSATLGAAPVVAVFAS